MTLKARPEDIERFMRYVEKLPSGCWFWTGGRSRGRGNRKWYGSFSLGNRTVRAHRFSSEVLGGEICPPGHHRDHLCRFSLCVNPKHIEVVTFEENQRRKVSGECLAPTVDAARLARVEQELEQLKESLQHEGGNLRPLLQSIKVLAIAALPLFGLDAEARTIPYENKRLVAEGMLTQHTSSITLMETFRPTDGVEAYAGGKTGHLSTVAWGRATGHTARPRHGTPTGAAQGTPGSYVYSPGAIYTTDGPPRGAETHAPTPVSLGQPWHYMLLSLFALGTLTALTRRD